MIKRWFKRTPEPQLRVLMVCMGNICRSPMAEAVMRYQLARAGLADRVAVDSAGTLSSHRGSPPDPRAVAQATRRGYALDGIRSRQFNDADFERHDLVLAMDRDNLETLREDCPPELQDRLYLLLSAAPDLPASEVPDPYYGSAAAFDRALDLIEAGCAAWLPHLQRLLREVDSAA